MKALGRQLETEGNAVGADRVDQCAMFVTDLGHDPVLHGAFNAIKPASLNAERVIRIYTALMLEELGKRISSRIESLNLDQTQVAKASGLTVQRLNNYIHARRTPDIMTLARLASALRTSTDYLLGADDLTAQVGRQVLTELLDATGMEQERIEAILDAAVEAMRILAVLPDEGDAALRSRMAARAAWQARGGLRPN